MTGIDGDSIEVIIKKALLSSSESRKRGHARRRAWTNKAKIRLGYLGYTCNKKPASHYYLKVGSLLFVLPEINHDPPSAVSYLIADPANGIIQSGNLLGSIEY